jgi:hypothetical protein
MICSRESEKISVLHEGLREPASAMLSVQAILLLMKRLYFMRR